MNYKHCEKYLAYHYTLRLMGYNLLKAKMKYLSSGLPVTLALKSILTAEKMDENNHNDTASNTGDFCSGREALKIFPVKFREVFFKTIVLELMIHINFEPDSYFLHDYLENVA